MIDDEARSIRSSRAQLSKSIRCGEPITIETVGAFAGADGDADSHCKTAITARDDLIGHRQVARLDRSYLRASL